MQNAWRFVDDEVLRERPKEAKGIGTPATRAEIIGGLKRQRFLTAQGKNIVPTDVGLSLFDVLKQADPDLVDPGVTARMEYLLDDVVLGKQEMVGAIDAVCEVAQRIIGKLTESSGGVPPLLVGSGGGGARSAAHKTKPRVGKFTRQKAAKSSTGRLKPSGASSKSIKKTAKNPLDGMSDVVMARSAVASNGVASNVDGDGRKSVRESTGRSSQSKKSGPKIAPPKRHRSAMTDAAPYFARQPPSEAHSTAETPLRIPFGNKETALSLGARYRQGGWYAPPGVDLGAFGERGWL